MQDSNHDYDDGGTATAHECERCGAEVWTTRLENVHTADDTGDAACGGTLRPIAADPMGEYLRKNADAIAARHAASAAWLAANMPSGAKDAHGNSVATLISALTRGAASYRCGGAA